MKSNEKKQQGKGMARIMEKAARKSAEAMADSRCAFIFHQPKMPKNLKDFKS